MTEFEERVLGPYLRHWQVISGFRSAMGSQDYALRQPLGSVSIFGTPQIFIVSPAIYLGDRPDLAQRRDALHAARAAAGALGAKLREEQQRAEAGRAALQQPEDLATVFGAAYDRLVGEWLRVHGPYYEALENGLAAAARIADTLVDNPGRVQVSVIAVKASDAALQAQLDAQLREFAAGVAAFQPAERRRRDFLTGP